MVRMPTALDPHTTATTIRRARAAAEVTLQDVYGCKPLVAESVVDEVIRSAYACSVLPQSRSHGFVAHELATFMDDLEHRDRVVAGVVAEWEELDPTFNREFRARKLRLATRRLRKVG